MRRTATQLVVGRDRERDDLADAIAASSERSVVLTVTGAPGSGKSTLLDAVAAVTVEGGDLVLRCAPAEAEVALPYAALGDLFADIHDLSRVAEPQRRALELALLRSSPGADDEATIDARIVGHATAQLLSALCRDDAPPTRRVVVLIDDVHWLDAASAAALQFALRRLPPTGVAVLASRRPGVTGPDLAGDSYVLPPLSERSLEAIIGERAAATRPIPLRRRREIVLAASGNPLFAIELARAETDGGERNRRSVPASLASVVSARFGRLDRATVDALAMVAMLGRPSIDTVHRLGIDEHIAAAERDGIVDTASGRVVFGHPLFAAAVIDSVPAMARRELHGRVATVVEDPIDADRHRALASVAPDADLAAALVAHATALVGRGATDHAADLAELAVRLSPPFHHERPAWHLLAADLAFRCGDADRCAQLLDGLGPPEGLEPTTRVAELLMRARIAYETGSGKSEVLATEAVALATNDRQRMEALTMLARVNYDDFDAAEQAAAEAIALAEHVDDVQPGLLAAALVARAEALLMAGHGLDRSLYERAVELERRAPVFASDSALGSFAVMLKITDQVDEAREMLLGILRADADDGAVPFVLSHLPQLELWAGNWDRAEEHAQSHLDAAVRTGQHDQVLQARFNLAYLDVHRGEPTSAQEVGAELVRLGRDTDVAWTERNGLGLLGLAALTRGDAVEAVRALTAWQEVSDRLRIREPGYCRLLPDLAEALVATDELDRADAIATSMRDEGTRLGRTTWLATSHRVAALVAAARGDRERAVDLARRAFEMHSTTPMVFEGARSLLTLGQVHRRFKEKAAARDALQRSLDVFRRLGAEGFAARATDDLARVGLRAAAASSLTETERRVARAAATGRTIRQIGGELFISPKTAEANLTRVYRKLGLRGRTDLAAWVAAGEPDPDM